MEKYNGLANRETWLVTLWLDNEQDTSTYWDGRAKELLEASWYKKDQNEFNDLDRINKVKYLLSRELENALEDGAPTTDGLYADLLNTALSKVDYLEVAEHYLQNHYK